MATQKYIGARYMPKFMGTYDATTAYEALSVVDNGSGTTYVANKPVPAGTALTDTDYWSVYGASSGAILDLQNRMGTAENDIDTLELRMGTAESALTTLSGRIDKLDSFNNLKNKTIAIYGASNELALYTQNDNWTDRLANALNGYSTVVNKSVGGRTLKQAITDYIADDDKASYDIVIFCCTKNLYIQQVQTDIGTRDSATPAIETSIASLDAYKLSGQKFYFASCTPYSDAVKTLPMCIYDGIVKKSAIKHGNLMLDMHSWLGCGDNESAAFTYDNLHFKAEVAPIFAARCLQALIAGNEPFTNYGAKLSGNDLFNWLAGVYTIPSGIGLDTFLPSKFYCDVDGKIILKLALVNLTGAEIPVNTMIMNTDVSKYLFALPSYMMRKFESVYNTSITYTNRSLGIRTETAIPNSAKFLVSWGDIDNYTEE